MTWRQGKEENTHFTDGKTEASRARHLSHSVKNGYFLSILLIDPKLYVDRTYVFFIHISSEAGTVSAC